MDSCAGVTFLLTSPNSKSIIFSLCPDSLDHLREHVRELLKWELLCELEVYNTDFCEYMPLQSLSELGRKAKLRALPPLKPIPDTTEAAMWNEAAPASFYQNSLQFSLPRAVEFLAKQTDPEPKLWEYLRLARGMHALGCMSLSPQQATLNFLEAMNSRYPNWFITSATESELLALMSEKAEQLKMIGEQLRKGGASPPALPIAPSSSLIVPPLSAPEMQSMLVAYQESDLSLQGVTLESKLYDYSTIRPRPEWKSVPSDKHYSIACIPELETDVRKLFFQSVPESVRIIRVDFVRNHVLRKAFEANLIKLASTTYEPLRQPFASTSEKELVHSRIVPYFKSATSNSKVKIGLCWGTNNAPDAVHELCHTGLTDIRVLSPGFFGTGICVTPQANYAIAYSPKPASPNADGEFCLLLCWAAYSNIYPVSRDVDYTGISSPSQFFDEKRGIALKAGFDSHCACVDPKRHYQAAKYVETTGGFDRDCKDLVDEILLKESAQALPYAIVWYKK